MIYGSNVVLKVIVFLEMFSLIKCAILTACGQRLAVGEWSQ